MKLKLKRLKPKKLSALLPFPRIDANKYSRGHLLIVGGSAQYPGAAILASRAAYNMGAGYVELYCDRDSLFPVRTCIPEVVAHSYDGFLYSAATNGRKPSSCLIGSGLDANDHRTKKLLADVLCSCEAPVVIDGGALGALASAEVRDARLQRAEKKCPTLLTPHFGEATRLAKFCGIEVPKQSYDTAHGMYKLASFAHELADVLACTVALKGPVTFIASHSQHKVFVMDNGTAALAKAGTGDVLAGMASALCAQSLSPINSAKLATYLHASAAKFAADDLSAISVCATDVIEYVPEAIFKLNGV